VVSKSECPSQIPAADDVKHAMEKLEKTSRSQSRPVRDTYRTLEPHQPPTDRTIR
jgi:hypothetical protein